jgi:hypothetical protein
VFKNDVFTTKLITFAIKSDLPFSIVENPYLCDLIDYLRKDVASFSRRTFGRRMCEMYNQCTNKLKHDLSLFKSKFSITCDVWTSKSQLSFFGITIHWIDDSWAPKETLLSFKWIEDRHTGANLARHLYDTLEFYGISERLLCITADNASNNTVILSDLMIDNDPRS